MRFVLTDRTIGPADGEPVLFQSTAPTGAKVAQAGALADWQRMVSIPCAGNSRLILALCMGFAAPCLRLTGADGGGIHLRGPSSVGKSTALALAASVYGPPAYRREWRQTDNGLEAVACMHSDMLLILDEIGTLEPRFAASVAYLLANGQGKARARRDGTLREPARWCLLFLSCGEEGLHDLLCRAGEQSRAGMEVRIVDLPADAGAGLGLFDRVPAGQSPGEFAETLRGAAARFYGVAFVTFLEHIIVPTGGIGYARGMLKHYSDKALDAFGIAPTATGQVRRVAQRFALIAAGGELATTYGVTGWTEGEATRAAARCFRDWLDTRGTDGPTEPVRMIAQVRAFIEQHGESRFASGKRANDDRAPRTMLRAGWTVECPDGSLDYLVFRETFRAEVCKGFDHRQVAAVLAERGALETEGSGDRRTGYTRKERLPDGIRARVYRIKAAIWTAEA